MSNISCHFIRHWHVSEKYRYPYRRGQCKKRIHPAQLIMAHRRLRRKFLNSNFSHKHTPDFRLPENQAAISQTTAYPPYVFQYWLQHLFSSCTCHSQGGEEKLLPFLKSWMWVSIAIPRFSGSPNAATYRPPAKSPKTRSAEFLHCPPASYVSYRPFVFPAVFSYA